MRSLVFAALPVTALTASREPARLEARSFATPCSCAIPALLKIATPAEGAELLARVQQDSGVLFIGVARRTSPRQVTPPVVPPGQLADWSKAHVLRPTYTFGVERAWRGPQAGSLTLFGSLHGGCPEPRFQRGRRYVVQGFRRSDSLLVGDCARALIASDTLVGRLTRLLRPAR